MHRSRSVAMMLAIPLGLCAAGCGNDLDDQNQNRVDLGVTTGADAAVTHPDSAVVVDGGGTTASVRFAQLSPDTSPVDICLAPAGTTNFGVPLIMQSGLHGGISYGNVTRYITLPAGTFDVRVTAGAVDGCSSGIVPDTNGVVFAPGSTLTVAMLGESGPGSKAPFTVKRYLDDTTAPTGQALLRFIQTAPELGTVDAGTIAGSTLTPLFAAANYSNIVTGSNIDPQGYLLTAPFVPPTTFGVRRTGTATIVTGPLPVPPGVPAAGVRTLFTIGGNTNGTTVMPNQPLQGLLCGDNLGPLISNSFLSNCIAFALN